MSAQPVETVRLPLFPLHTVLFPAGLLALRVFEPRYRRMVERCLAAEQGFGVCLIAAGEEAGEAAVPHLIGTEARILAAEPDYLEPDGNEAPARPTPSSTAEPVLHLAVQGMRRFRLVDHELEADGLLMGSVEWFPAAPAQAVPAERHKLLPLLQAIVAERREQIAPPHDFDDASWVGMRFAEILPISLLAKQKLLELEDPLSRLEIIEKFLLQRGLL